MSTGDKTLFVVRDWKARDALRTILPRGEFDVCAVTDALAGRRYKRVVLASSRPESSTEGAAFDDFVNVVLRTKLPPGGEFLVVA